MDLPALTGIRGVAAIWVVWHHFYSEWILLVPDFRWLAPLVEKGVYAVDFFFMLSGFVLCHAQRSKGGLFTRKDYGKFIWLRVARVFPNHAVTLLVLILMLLAARMKGISVEGDYPVSGLPFQFSMTQNFPGIEGGAWNYPAWSISAEWFAYLLVFPLAWWIVKRNPGLLFSAAAVIVLMLLWCLASTVPDRIANQQVCIRVVCGFLSGALIYSIYSNHRHHMEVLSRSTIGFVAAVLLSTYLIGNELLCHSLILAGFFPFILLGLTRVDHGFSKWMAGAFMVWLGHISYALYMSHAITEKFLKVALNPERFQNSSFGVRVSVLSLNVVAILAGAVALHNLVEVPCRNYLRRWKGLRIKKPSPIPG